VSDLAVPPDLPEEVISEFTQLSSFDRLSSVAQAMEDNGIRASVVETGAKARERVASLLPAGSEVFNNTSRTLELIGIADDIERSGRYEPLRLRLFQMDREMQAQEMRTLAASPDFVVGSVHALTEDGSLLIASASGSQLGPIVSGAGHVIFVIGGQKVVPDLETGIRRIVEYSFPLEDDRARNAYGVASGVNNVLIINRVVAVDRITAILVHESLGF
jgi:L-lactate utilization protein LutC